MVRKAGVMLLGFSACGFDLVAQEAVGAGEPGLGGGEVFAEFGYGGSFAGGGHRI